MYQVFDNMVPQCLVDEIYEEAFNRKMPWLFLPNVSVSNGTRPNNSGFNHLFFGEECGPSEYFSVVKPLPYLFVSTGLIHTNFRIQRCRSFLQMPDPKLSGGHNTPHKDMEAPHTVLLYYVNDSDGDTVLFSKDDDKTVTARVPPKRGRVLIFDGQIIHASSPPTSGPRAIVNFDLVWTSQN